MRSRKTRRCPSLQQDAQACDVKFKKLDEDLRTIVMERAAGDAKKALAAAGEHHQFCEGRPGERCIFSDKGDHCRMNGNMLKCLFCGSVEDMVALLQSPNGQRLMAARLRRITHGTREKKAGRAHSSCPSRRDSHGVARGGDGSERKEETPRGRSSSDRPEWQAGLGPNPPATGRRVAGDPFRAARVPQEDAR